MYTVSQDLELSRRSMWFGLLGGAIAWTVHLIFAYAIAEFGCVGGLGHRHYLGLSLVAWAELALAAATALAGSAATAVAYQRYRRGRSPGDPVAEPAERNADWTCVITSGLFTFTIVFESIPILYYLQDC